MAIESINVGNIANDGTGDDLREAFVKVNNNFIELDLRQPEQTTAVNLGSGQGIFDQKTNYELKFKSLLAGSNVTLTDLGSEIRIDSPIGLESILTVTQSGSITITQGNTFRVFGDNGITTSVDSENRLIISGTQGLLSADTTPQLSTALNASNQNINNVATISASLFSGDLEGNVFGVDIRPIANYFVNFDFGAIRPVFTNTFEIIAHETDVDLGPIEAVDRSANIEGGNGFV